MRLITVKFSSHGSDWNYRHPSASRQCTAAIADPSRCRHGGPNDTPPSGQVVGGKAQIELWNIPPCTQKPFANLVKASRCASLLKKWKCPELPTTMLSFLYTLPLLFSVAIAPPTTSFDPTVVDMVLRCEYTRETLSHRYWMTSLITCFRSVVYESNR